MPAKRKKVGTLDSESALPLQEILGPPFLLEDEDIDAYMEFLRLLREEIKPHGILEELWVQDVVDHCWQIPRWRRLQAELHGRLAQWDSHPFPDSNFGTVSANLQSVESQIASAEQGRNVALREISFYRATFAERLKASLNRHCLSLPPTPTVTEEGMRETPGISNEE
jgi:hypothetical protein